MKMMQKKVIYKTETNSQISKIKFTVSIGETVEDGIGTNTRLHVREMTNKDLPCSTGKSAQ